MKCGKCKGAGSQRVQHGFYAIQVNCDQCDGAGEVTIERLNALLQAGIYGPPPKPKCPPNTIWREDELVRKGIYG